MASSDGQSVVRFAGLTFDAGRRQLRRADGEEVHVTPKAFDLLTVLIDAAPRVVPKAELHERLWPQTFVSEATLTGLVRDLRRALGDRARDAPIIRTASRVGYAFCAPVEARAPSTAATQHWIVVQGGTIALHSGENVIGRDPASTVWLDDTAVSRRHARIVIHADRALLEDLGSKNGTKCGEALLTAPTALRDGDRIGIGPIVMVYRWSDSGMSTTSGVTTI
jgi:DNA-binding winged helix-turn-helix (wHTH) protein